MPHDFTPPSARLASRLHAFATNLHESCGLESGLDLKFLDQPLDYAAQLVLMRRGYRQKFKADAGRPGPADGGIVDYDGLGLTRNMQVDGELHAGKGADDTVHAASLGRKVAD